MYVILKLNLFASIGIHLTTIYDIIVYISVFGFSSSFREEH